MHSWLRTLLVIAGLASLGIGGARAAFRAPTSVDTPATTAAAVAPATLEPQSDRVTFAVRMGDVVTTHRVFGVPVMPGETVPVDVLNAGANEVFDLSPGAGVSTPLAATRWLWTAPATPGLYPITVTQPGGSSITLNVFVMVPRQGRAVNGYAIGRYPAPPRSRANLYAAPEGFIEVNAQTASAQVSPNFTLGQFVCKQGSGWPKYVALQPALYSRLETVLDGVRARGIDASTLTVMSGFRTPVYNAGLENVKYSRHTYGDAADVFVDEFPRDGRMDDLNRDGRLTAADARWLKSVVEQSVEPAPHAHLEGGLGAYAPGHAHGGFVHVDTRGYRARWGV